MTASHTAKTPHREVAGTTALAVVNCGQLVTLRGPNRPRAGSEFADLGMIADGALFVDGSGRIARAGERREMERDLPADAEVVDAGGRVVLPGFVDAHTHLVFAGQRADEMERRARGETYQEITAAGGGILSTVRKTRAASDDALRAAGRRHARWALRGGTTTLEAKSGYGLDWETERRLLRTVQRLAEEGEHGTGPRIVPTFLAAHAVPEEFRGRKAAFLELAREEMLPAVAQEKLAEYVDAFCEPGWFEVEECRALLQTARALGFGLRMHADQLRRSGGAELAAELGATTADHLEQLDTAGIHALRDAGVQPVLLPGSVYALGSRHYPPAREMIAAGLAVVLATDFNPGTSPSPSIPMALSLAVTQMRITPAEALSAVTINAAHSLGRGNQIGSLEPGKLADFVIHDAEDWREIPYWFGVETARDVFVGGRRVFSRESTTS